MSDGLRKEIAKIKMGPPTDFRNFFNAVIDRAAFHSIKEYITSTKENEKAEIFIGGKCDDLVGYFIEPTVILAREPNYRTMVEKIFGPVLTVYVYADEEFEQTLELCDQSSLYALTGSTFAIDRAAISLALAKLSECR